MRIPASVAYSVPAATAPRVPRAESFTGREGAGRCCAETAPSIANKTAILSFIWMLFIVVPTWKACIIQSFVEESEPKQQVARKDEGEPMLYCPRCSTRLTELKCKLVCGKCGYYLSCADYY
jgi:ribosomal protein S27AE